MRVKCRSPPPFCLFPTSLRDNNSSGGGSAAWPLLLGAKSRGFATEGWDQLGASSPFAESGGEAAGENLSH